VNAVISYVSFVFAHYCGAFQSQVFQHSYSFNNQYHISAKCSIPLFCCKTNSLWAWQYYNSMTVQCTVSVHQQFPTPVLISPFPFFLLDHKAHKSQFFWDIGAI